MLQKTRASSVLFKRFYEQNLASFTHTSRALLHVAPPWPVKQTSAVNIMRAIHLEKKVRQAVVGGQVVHGGPPPVIHKAV